jgi:hypothetical protein
MNTKMVASRLRSSKQEAKVRGEVALFSHRISSFKLQDYAGSIATLRNIK